MIRPRHVLVLAVALAACGGSEAPTEETVRARPGGAPSPAPAPIPAEVQAHLDEGNAAFEAGNLSGALRSFEAAVEADSTVAPAWFGVYMTYEALGETEKAGEIQARIVRMSAPGPGDPHAAPTDGGAPTLEGAEAQEDGA